MLKAQAQDKDEIAQLLTRCFDSNNSVNYIIPQDRHRSKRITRLMEYSFDYCQLFGAVYLSPEAQHKGIGTTLLKTLLDKYDQQGLPVYLETSVERNLPWYKKWGFTVYEELDLGYRLYCLRRG